MNAKSDGALDPAACLRILGLPEAATAGQIKRAYRLMAQRFHPDKVGDHEVDRRHFETISDAYRLLMTRARLIDRGKSVGRCCVCREFGEVLLSLDGLARCPRCALQPGGRPLLPLPNITIVKCVGASALLLIAVFMLIGALRHHSPMLAAMGALAGAASVGVLAATCMRVVYCVRK